MHQAPHKASRYVQEKQPGNQSIHTIRGTHHSSSIVPIVVSITGIRGHGGRKEKGRRLTWRLRRRIVDDPRNAVDFVDNPPRDGLEESPRELVRLGAHHVQAGHGSQNADIPVDPGVSLHAHGYGTNLSQQNDPMYTRAGCGSRAQV